MTKQLESLISKDSSCFHEKDTTQGQAESPEKAEKLSRGLTAIDEEERKYFENKKISRENAEKVTVTVKKAHPVFKSLAVVDGGETWDYDYVASLGRRKEGLRRQRGKQMAGLKRERLNRLEE